MSPKFIALLIFIWITGSLMGSVIEGSYLGEAQKGTFDSLLVWKELEIDQVWDVFKIPVAVGEFFGALYQMMAFDFSFLEGNSYGQLFRWIILGPIIGVLVYGIIITVIGLFNRVLGSS